MLKLQAYCPNDGWALVQTSEGLRLIRPPYTSTNSRLVPANAIPLALQQPGFVAADREFVDWKAIIHFLNAEIARSREPDELLSNADLGEAMLEIAPEETLARFLKKVEDELLPAQHFQHAEAVVREITKAANERELNCLVRSALALQERISNESQQLSNDRKRLSGLAADFAGSFPLGVKRYGEQSLLNYSKEISEHQPIFPVG